jgi:hypothetical protein
MRSSEGTRMAFQRRNWSGQPRERIYRSTYYHVDPTDKVTVVRQEARAITAREITQFLHELGMTDTEWVFPERFGYYQPMCVSRRPQVMETRPSRLAVHRVRSAPTYRAKSLVMWRGGLSSTLALVQTLKDTQSDIVVHHIGHSSSITAHPDPISFSGHELGEVSRLLKLIKQRCRPFEVSVSSIGPGKLDSHTYMMNIVGYFAAQVAMSQGMIVADRIMLGRYGSDIEALCRPDDPYQNGRFLFRQMIKTVMRSEDVPQVCVPTPLPGQKASMRYLMDALGSEYITMETGSKKVFA